MNKAIILRYSEISLKGKNRNIFENKLIDNIRFYFNNKNIVFEKIIKTHSRIIILTDEKINLKPIFGIVSYSFTEFLDYNKELLDKNILEFAKKSIQKNDTFRVSVQRIDKRIEEKSVDMERRIGELIYEELDNDVSLKNPDKNISIELIEGKSYIFDNKTDCFGGLPLGVDNESAVIIEDKKSVLAAILMMKRGIFTNPIIKVKDVDIDLLKEYVNTNKKFEIIELKDKKNAFDYLKEKMVPAVIVGDLLNDINIDDKFIEETSFSKTENVEHLLIIRPLINLIDEEVDEKLEIFKEALI
jgi:adenylyl- and sulfurtransferase ThiI